MEAFSVGKRYHIPCKARSMVLIFAWMAPLLLNSLQVVASFTHHCSRQWPARKRRNPKGSGVECFQTGESSSNDSNNYFRHLVSQFQGDFDNYHQVLRDRHHTLTPAEGGGHEHIHCTLVPCPQSAVSKKQHHQKDQWILAAFYFNGNPRQIFRFRMYKLVSPKDDDNNNNKIDDERVRMKLHTLSPGLEKQLRQYSDQPCTWWREAYAVWLNSTNEGENESVDLRSNKWNTFHSEGIQRLVSPLIGCDVLWDPQWDPKKHTYLNVDEYNDTSSSSCSPPTSLSNYSNDEGYHATMEAGSKGAIVDSISLIPGKRILIKDELSLWENEFWINDRGYDPDAVAEEEVEVDESRNGVGIMPFVYGNRRGIPYKLERVSCISTMDTNDGGDEMYSLPLLLERTVSKQELAWTLGEAYREQAVYESKLLAVEKALLHSNS